MKNTIRYIAGLLLLLLPSVAGAQALPFLAAETDVVSLGAAGADVTGTSSIAYSAFKNAAVIPFSEKTADFEAGYTMWQPSGATDNVINIAGAYNFRQKFGFALGLSYGIHRPYDVISGSGRLKEAYRPADMQLNAGLSWRFLPYMSLGVTLGYARQTLAEEASYNAFNTDIFLMSKFSGFSVALGVSNFGSAVSSSAGYTFYLPSSATLGLGYDMVFAQKHGVNIHADADYYWQTSSVAAALGAEYVFDDFVSVRAGYRYGGDSPVPSYASIGAGVKLYGADLNLAYLIADSASPLKNTFAVSLGYCF